MEEWCKERPESGSLNSVFLYLRLTSDPNWKQASNSSSAEKGTTYNTRNNTCQQNRILHNFILILHRIKTKVTQNKLTEKGKWVKPDPKPNDRKKIK